MIRQLHKSLFSLLLIALSATATPLKAEVVVLIPPQAFVVSKIAAETLTVTTLLPVSQSLEHFSPSPSHLRALENAKLYLRLGHPAISVEPQLIDQIVSEAKIPTVTMSSKIKLNSYDPHYWLSLQNIKPMIDVVLPELIKLKPEHTALYQQNAAALEAAALALHTELAAKLAPIAGKSFMVFHPSWEYFAESFGLKQIAIEQHGSEPGPRQLEQIISQARQAEIRCVFEEPQLSSAAVKAIAEHIGAKVGMLNPLNQDIFAGVGEAAEKIFQATTNGACSVTVHGD